MLTFGLALLLLLASIGIIGATLARRGSTEQTAIDPTAEPTSVVAIVATPVPSPSPTPTRPVSITRTASARPSATSRTTPTAVAGLLGAGPGRAARGIGGSMAISLGGTLPPPEVAVNPTPTRAAAAASGPVAPTPTPVRSTSGGSSSGSSGAAPTPTPYRAPSGGSSSGSGSSGSGSSGSGSSGSGSSAIPPTPTPRPPVIAPTATIAPTPPPSLPAATLPGPGSRTYSYKFTYSRDGAFIQPTDAQAWIVTWRTFTIADANNLKAALGMTGAVEQVGGGFRITGPGTLLLNNTLGTISYTAPTTAAKGALEVQALPTITTIGTPTVTGTPVASPNPSTAPSSAPSAVPQATSTPSGTTRPIEPSATPTPTTQLSDQAAIAAAREWLSKAGLMSANADPGLVTRPTPGQIVVTFHPQTPGSLIPQDPMIQVKLAADGTVREVYHRWPTKLEPREVALRDVNVAWSEVVAGGGYLEVFQTVPADLPANTVFTGNAVVTKVSIGWAPGTTGTTNYLVPLYVFEGTVTLTNPPAGQPAAVPFRVYIAATTP